jgi:hypothetical protein
MESENYLYLPEATPDDGQLVENLGFIRLDPASFKWSVPGTKELISDFKPVNSKERGVFGSRKHPYVAREVHYVYRNAHGEPILWSCIAEVHSDLCMCFGRQYAISVTGPCKFKARRHVHVHGPPPPPPTAAELEARKAAHFALEQKALAGEKSDQFIIELGDEIRSMRESIIADVIQALKNAHAIQKSGDK